MKMWVQKEQEKTIMKLLWKKHPLLKKKKPKRSAAFGGGTTIPVKTVEKKIETKPEEQLNFDKIREEAQVLWGSLINKDEANALFSINEYLQKENCTIFYIGTLPVMQKCYICNICNPQEDKYICHI